MNHNILVPLDGSGFAEQALPLALDLARREGASLDLVQVHELYALNDPHAGWLPYDAATDALFREQERAYLADLGGRLAGLAAVGVTTAVLDGFPADGILERAQATRPGLVVMTTHGRGPVSRAFLGSVTDEVVRRAPVPVLLVRPREETVDLSREPPLRRVLVPLDRSAEGKRILGPARELCRLTGASATLLHVVESARAPLPRGAAAPPVPDGRPAVEGQERAAAAYLEKVAGWLRDRVPAVRTRVVLGRSAAAVILEEAGAYDLVALATHGRRGVRRLLLGSVADKVIRGSATPVLLSGPSSE
jgi:nucleotide-binding universal stress UspA family protein